MRRVLLLATLFASAAVQAQDRPVRTIDTATLGGIPKSHAVPEPASIAALGVGAMGLLRSAKRRKLG